MCVRTQLAPSWQTLQVGEASRVSRGSPERVLNSDRSCILQKLDLRNRVQAVVLAYETGLVHPCG
jgi:hypothetical protein